MIALTVRCFNPWFSIAHRYEAFSMVGGTATSDNYSQSVDHNIPQAECSSFKYEREKAKNSPQTYSPSHTTKSGTSNH
jgi:hypothetical protein